MADVLKRVLLVVSGVTTRDPEALSSETLIEDLALDSLDEVEILMILEEELDVIVDQTQVNSCRSLGELAALIENSRGST